MALTYEESAALMLDATFVSRIKVACLIYATYIINEPPDTDAHSARLRGAGNTVAAPDVTARNVAPMVTMDSNVQAQGSAISDADLQTAVETAVNKVL